MEIEALEIAKAIAAAGGRSLIAAHLSSHEKIPPDLPSNITFIDLPLHTKNPLQIIQNISLLKTVIRKEKVDIVHARSRGPAWSAYRAARSLKIPFITTYHAAYRSKTCFKTLYNSVMARGDCVITISRFIHGHVIQKYGTHGWFDTSKLRLVPRGIDMVSFDPSAISEERVAHLRESWKIPQHMRLILLPGRMSRSKGHHILIQALPLMKHTNVMALFVGSAQGHETYRDQLLQEAAALNLKDRIRCSPLCPDVPAAYKLADIIVCPSLVPEGFGRVIAEAQAMEKPIIASAHGAAVELVAPDITGWLVPPHDAHALAHALDQWCDLPQRDLEAMGKRGRDFIQSAFTQDHMWSKTIAVYKEFVQNTH